jgi:hypothetical protein
MQDLREKVAVITGGASGIPEDLGIVVGVDVDESGRDDQSRGVEGLRAFETLADRDDPVSVDRNVGPPRRLTGPVHDSSTADDEFCHGPSLHIMSLRINMEL